jgi:hypothetical protein
MLESLASETSMLELMKLLLNTLYLWIAAHHCLGVFTYADFLNLFSVFFLLGVLLYNLCVLGLRPFAPY